MRAPTGVADDQRGTAGREQVGLDHLHLTGDAQAFGVLAGTGQRPRILVGGHDPAHTAPGEHRGQYAGAGADVERQLVVGQRRLGHQVHILAAGRGEDAVMRVDTVAAERRDLDALPAPFVGADEREEFAQRDEGGGRVRALGAVCGFRGGGLAGAVRPGAGLADVGGAMQRDGEGRVERNQQHAQDAGAVILGRAVHMERLGGIGGRRLARAAVDAAGQRRQQLAGVVEVAAPQQRGALAGEFVGVVGLRPVVRDDDAAGWRGAILGAPTGGTGLVGLGPFDDRRLVHRNVPRVWVRARPRGAAARRRSGAGAR